MMSLGLVAVVSGYHGPPARKTPCTLMPALKALNNRPTLLRSAFTILNLWEEVSRKAYTYIGG